MSGAWARFRGWLRVKAVYREPAAVPLSMIPAMLRARSL